MHKRVWLAVGAIALAASGACATPFGGDSDAETEPSPEPRPELSEPASTLPAAEQPPPTSASRPDEPPPTETPGATTTEPGTATTTPATTTRQQARRLATLDDPAGDAGLEAPRYADLVTVGLDDVDATVRVSVDMAADVPGTLAEGEVQGIGIDIFRTSAQESDYQIFLDGGADGWRAYLQTPKGFVDYPGTFAIGGRRLIVEVPWSAIGGREDAALSVFCDWSARAVPLNQSASDRAPDRGTAAFSV